MNEKIEELYEKSTTSFYIRTDAHGNRLHGNHTNYKKFAELIIQECCGVCERLQDSLDRQNWPTPYECATAIKEHFEIE
jgi:hypothetical protein